MQKGKVITLLLVVGVMLGLIVGCGENNKDTTSNPDSNEQTTIRFTWWGGQERADTTNEAVELFMEQNPDIKVETSFYPFDSYYEQLNVSASGGNLPDIFSGYVGDPNINTLIDKGMVESFDEYIESGVINVNDISENLLGLTIYLDKTYGLPLGINGKVMYVDPDVYEKAGLEIPELAYESYDTMEADLVKLKEATGAYGSDDIFNHEFLLDYWARQHGEVVLTDEGDSVLGISKETYVDYYHTKLDWIDKGLIPPYDVTAGQVGLEDSELAKGNSAAIPGYTNQYGVIADAAAKKLTPLLLPGPNTVQGTDLRIGVYAFMADSKDEAKKEAAAKLMDFLLNSAEANLIMKADRGMPASDKVRYEILPDLDENLQISAEAMNLVVENSSPSDPAVTKDVVNITELIGELDEQISFKIITPEEAYDQLEEIAKK